MRFLEFLTDLKATKDQQKTKRILKEMMQTFVHYRAQYALMTLFIARGLAMITQNLPEP